MIRLAVAALALLLAANTLADARSSARPKPTAAVKWDVTAEQRVEDLNWLVDKLKAKYAYRDKKSVDLDQIKTNYREAAEKAATPKAWLAVVERVRTRRIRRGSCRRAPTSGPRSSTANRPSCRCALEAPPRAQA
jgi:hypothetical protein